MKTILLTGGNGYIATSILHCLSNDYNIASICRRDFDLLDSDKVKEWFTDKYFDVIIHTAVEGGNRLKHETGITAYNNLLMYDNLIDCKDHFQKLITFGSGAELSAPKSPYGLSKRIINESIVRHNNFYNIRVFAVFDENENDRRFIKSNIVRYLKKQPITIYENKKMDFFYMQDLISIVRAYIDRDDLPKSIDCSYDKHLSLLDIANLINGLGEHHVDIVNMENHANDYIGTPCDLNDLIGIERGIKITFNQILER